MGALDTSKEDNSVGAVVMDGLHAAAYTGLKRPYTSIQEWAHQVNIDLPNLNMDAPQAAPVGSWRWGAQEVGSVAGMLPYVIGSNFLAKGLLNKLGLSTTVALTGQISLREAALTGGIFSGLFEPTMRGGNFVDFATTKITNVGITTATFTAGAAVNNLGRPIAGYTFGKARAMGLSEGVTAPLLNGGVGVISGFTAGAANAELNTLAGRPNDGILTTGVKYGLLGGFLGLSSGRSTLASEADTMGIGVKPRGAGESAVPPGQVESPYFGTKPQELAQVAEQTRATHGDVSPQTAQAYTSLGDAYAVEGLASRGQAVAAYEQALAASKGSPTTQAAIFEKLALSDRQAGNFQGAVDYMTEALKALRSEANPNTALISAQEARLQAWQAARDVQGAGG